MARLLPSLAILSLSLALVEPLPAQTGNGWQVFGPRADTYEAGFNRTIVHGGKVSMVAASLAPADSSSWIAINQVVDAAAYRGSRLRYSLFLSTIDAYAADIFMIVYQVGHGSTSVIAQDSSAAPQRGTTSWRRPALIVDIPASASCISFGARLAGVGKMLLDDATLAVVPATIPATARAGPPEVLKDDFNPCKKAMSKPTNLGFEE